jgi:stage II sporulation protein D
MARLGWIPLVLLLLPLPGGAEPLLRIAVAEGRQEVRIGGDNLRFRLLDGEGGYQQVRGGSLLLRHHGGAITLPDGASGTSLKLRGDGPITVAGTTVRGSLEVRVHGDGLLVVNEIPMETYLAAVLGSEMMPSFHQEALKAQAVAARTYSLRKRLESLDRPYDLGATVLSQVYGGVHREDPRTRQAVAATTGQVLVHDHEPIEAYFFSSCGGETENGGDALGRPLPYLRAVSCSEHPQTRHARWSLELGGGELARALGQRTLRSLRVERRTETGRVATVSFEGDGGKRSMNGAEFRRRLGYASLRSLAFDVHRKGSAFRFEGRGNGHGAGMCQWGAQAAATGGWSFERILSHYYAGAELRRMY